MRKSLITIIILIILFPNISLSQTKITEVTKPIDVKLVANRDYAIIAWTNTQPSYNNTVIFRTQFPIETFFTFEAVERIGEKIYEGSNETYTDTGLPENLTFYYTLFALNRGGEASKATVLKKEIVKDKPITSFEINIPKEKVNTLANANSDTVNQVTFTEAGTVYSYNQAANTSIGSETGRLALFIIARSPHSLSDNDKNSIAYFINEGTPTTIILGSGERAGVLNSYMSVFEKLPTNTLEWQDVIKIANGRWPDERKLESEEKAANSHFFTIYARQPDMDNPKDNAAVTVIAYGLRPAQRNLESEKAAIDIYRNIFGKAPIEATDWDLVRAIAYSGAVR